MFWRVHLLITFNTNIIKVRQTTNIQIISCYKFHDTIQIKSTLYNSSLTFHDAFYSIMLSRLFCSIFHMFKKTPPNSLAKTVFQWQKFEKKRVLTKCYRIKKADYKNHKAIYQITHWGSQFHSITQVHISIFHYNFQKIYIPIQILQNVSFKI